MGFCIFCKIAQADLPCYKVYEDDLVLAFLDINPLNIGHTLVIPKEHSDTLLSMSDRLNERVLKVCKKVSLALKKTKPDICSGISIYSAVGPDSGQEVFHTHIHVIPRYSGDGFVFRRNSSLNFKIEKFKELSMNISVNIELNTENVN